jgi:hypothetical protein
MASGVQSVPIATGTASGAVGPTAKDTRTQVTFYGYTFRETAGAVATVRIHDGGVIGGAIIAAINLAANQSVDISYLPQGLIAYGGVYYEKVAGTVEGSIRVG